ncbi:MAG: hypothetical protein DHS20C20_30170 [Ardenticatenaceae bacterium]|nr:MAG: hypothetical protein DHS20C20_30170 [Ardenticatenaceae bacterium]
MLMDDPKDWKARIKSLQTAVSETLEMMEVVRDDHAEDVLLVFDAEMTDDMDTPFEAIQAALGTTSPRQFLKLPAKNRPKSIPKPLRKIKVRDFYQLVQETIQVDNCIKILAGLDNFADEGFDFFLKGYYTKKNLPVASGCPPRTIMRTLVNQASFDLSVIQHAVNQRRRLNGLATEQGKAVAMADQLASMALGIAVDEGYLPENATVITYLAKSVRARLIPYYDALLISVAYASIQNGIHPTRDYLALPHEIGHHLYWNGRHPQTGQELRDLLLDNAATAGIGAGDWRLNWLEEIFCDLYAILLAGPVIILDFQDMLDDDMSDHFREDTDKHPIPELRPFIQTNILRRAKDEDGNVIYAHECDKLDENWRNWIQAHPLKASYLLRGTTEAKTGKEIVNELEALITVILETVPGFVPDERYFDGMEGTDDLSKLYQEFQGYIMPDDDNELVNMFLDGTGSEKQLARILDSYSDISFAQHIQEVTKRDPKKINSAEWLHILRSFGWSNEGPLGSIGGTLSGGGTISATAQRTNNNNDLLVSVSLSGAQQGLNVNLGLGSNVTTIYCDPQNAHTFSDVGTRGGVVVISGNGIPNLFLRYGAATN